MELEPNILNALSLEADFFGLVDLCKELKKCLVDDQAKQIMPLIGIYIHPIETQKHSYFMNSFIIRAQDTITEFVDKVFKNVDHELAQLIRDKCFLADSIGYKIADSNGMTISYEISGTSHKGVYLVRNQEDYVNALEIAKKDHITFEFSISNITF